MPQTKKEELRQFWDAYPKKIKKYILSQDI